MNNTSHFLPKFGLEKSAADTINQLAGGVIKSDFYTIDFINSVYELPSKMIELSLYNEYINSRVFLKIGDVQPLIGVELKDISVEYFLYLINYYLGPVGFSAPSIKLNENNSIERLLYNDECERLFFLCNIQINSIVIDFYFDILSVKIFSEIEIKKNHVISGGNKLALSVKIFETYLTAKEINELSSDDLVLLYRF